LRERTDVNNIGHCLLHSALRSAPAHVSHPTQTRSLNHVSQHHHVEWRPVASLIGRGLSRCGRCRCHRLPSAVAAAAPLSPLSASALRPAPCAPCRKPQLVLSYHRTINQKRSTLPRQAQDKDKHKEIERRKKSQVVFSITAPPRSVASQSLVASLSVPWPPLPSAYAAQPPARPAPRSAALPFHAASPPLPPSASSRTPAAPT
jgi:hypothetical protein